AHLFRQGFGWLWPVRFLPWFLLCNLVADTRGDCTVCAVPSLLSTVVIMRVRCVVVSNRNFISAMSMKDSQGLHHRSSVIGLSPSRTCRKSSLLMSAELWLVPDAGPTPPACGYVVSEL